ncbi:hypothetical protein PCI56_13270 [Plesiomonas shigelloides subsp. oncorhynchi]|nr:hypothetical protein [Plesiomonas shigelloides]
MATFGGMLGLDPGSRQRVIGSVGKKEKQIRIAVGGAWHVNHTQTSILGTDMLGMSWPEKFRHAGM